MAAEESDREDLLREATGLVHRIEFRVPWHDEPIVAGFRRNGACSLFFGQAEVYQFDTSCRWRRGYLHGQLLKAVDGRLVQMRRERSVDATTLLSQPVSAAQTAAYRDQLTRRLQHLAESLATGDLLVVGQVSAAASDVRDRLSRWLARRPPGIEIAATPRVR